MGKRNQTTALIVGAGAIENAWIPVLRALGKYFDFPLTPDGANSYLARVVYLLRWWHSDTLPNTKVDTGFRDKERSKHLDFLIKLRQNISEELLVSQDSGEIRARVNLGKLLSEHLYPFGKRFIVVTTNWDTVFEKAVERIMSKDFHLSMRALHIHGSTDDPNLMYLPSEMTKEPYRTKDEEKAIGGMHRSIWEGLETAHRHILYGVSIDPLDAELCQTGLKGSRRNY